MRPLNDCLLYAFVDTAYLRGRSPELLARQLCEGGADLVQLRAKGWAVDEVRRLAARLLPITASAGIGLVINDHPGVALEVGAPLCHLGQEDFFDAGFTEVAQVFSPTQAMPHPEFTPNARSAPADRREHARVSPMSAGPTSRTVPAIGLSTHTPIQAERALAAGPAYVAIGPVFRTDTKPNATPVTLEYVRWAAAHVPIPWFAIGGITLENLDSVLAAGANRICVVSAILGAPNPVRACQAFKERVLSAARNRQTKP